MQRIFHLGVSRPAAAALRSVFSARASWEPASLVPLTSLRTESWTSSPRWLHTSAAAWMAAPRKPTAGVDQPDAPPPRSDADPGQGDLAEPDPLQDSSVGLVQRFKRTLKQYGKVMIPVHLVTSTVWFGTFYYAAMKGVNVVPFLEYVGFPERLVKLLENSQSGYALTAYAMYKIATPARYTVTLGGTSLSVKYLRKHGHLSTPPPVKEYIQDKMEETRERLSGRLEETRDKLSGRLEDTRDKLSGRLEDTKDKLSGKLEDTKDKVSLRKKQE